MFDFLSSRGRSNQEKQQEMLNAYLDGDLTHADRDRFEQQLAQNVELRNELAEMQLWQQQMRDLPARRVPRNFTLDPTLYGRPQRQFWGSAYPALRMATALTAVMLIVALVANVYVNSFSTGAIPQAAVAPATESVALETMEVEEAASAEIESPAEEFIAPEMTEESPPATPFALETTVDKESEAAEAPVEITAGGGGGAPEGAEVAEEPAGEPEFSKQEDPLDEELREELAQSLDILEGTSEPPLAGAREAPPPAADEALITEDVVIEESLLATVPAEISEEQLPDLEDNTTPAANIPLSLGLAEVSIGLGVLFILLIILTLIARRRR